MKDYLKNSIKELVMDIHGPLLMGDALWKDLGYPSKNAFHQALFKGCVSVPLVDIPNRHKKYALLHDVVEWLVEQRFSNPATDLVPDKDRMDAIPYPSKRLFLMEQGMLMHEKTILSNTRYYPNFNRLAERIPWFRLDGRGKKRYALSYEAIPLFMGTST